MSGPARQVLAIVAAVILFHGCAAFAPRADPSNFYMLGALPDIHLAEGNPVAAIKANFTVGLGPIELPGYLDRQQIATRTSTNRLNYSETDRWAAPLGENFSRVLAQNLSQLLNPAQIISFPWLSIDAPDYQVKIEVVQFEGNSNQEAWLTARWSVIDSNKKILVDQRSHVNRRAGSLSTENFVTALSEALGDLSREIVKTLRSFERPGNT